MATPKPTTRSFRFDTGDNAELELLVDRLSAMCGGCQITNKAAVVKALEVANRLTDEEFLAAAGRQASP